MSEETKTINVVAKYDCITGKRMHYVIGSKRSPIAGGLYIVKGEPVPEKIVLTLVKENK